MASHPVANRCASVRVIVILRRRHRDGLRPVPIRARKVQLRGRDCHAAPAGGHSHHGALLRSTCQGNRIGVASAFLQIQGGRRQPRRRRRCQHHRRRLVVVVPNGDVYRTAIDHASVMADHLVANRRSSVRVVAILLRRHRDSYRLVPIRAREIQRRARNSHAVPPRGHSHRGASIRSACQGDRVGPASTLRHNQVRHRQPRLRCYRSHFTAVCESVPVFPTVTMSPPLQVNVIIPSVKWISVHHRNWRTGIIWIAIVII